MYKQYNGNITQQWKEMHLNTCNDMHEYYVEPKPDGREYILYNSTYIKFRKRQIYYIVSESRADVPWNWGRAGVTEMKHKELFEVMKMFCVLTLVVATLAYKFVKIYCTSYLK